VDKAISILKLKPNDVFGNKVSDCV